MPEYIIKFGESLDSNEKVLSAALQVMARLTPNASDAEIHNAIIKAGMESWALDSLKQPPMSDCKAVYSLIIQVLNRGGVEPDARQAKIEELARQRQDALKKEGAYLSDQKEADFFALLDEIEELYPGTNRKELLAYMEAFAAKIKDLQRRQGLRPCRTEDCIRIVEGRRNKKYCSNHCKRRHHQILKRRRDPDAHQRANLKYLKSVLEDDE